MLRGHPPRRLAFANDIVKVQVQVQLDLMAKAGRPKKTPTLHLVDQKVIDAILAAMAPARKSMTPAAHKGAMGDNLTFFGVDNNGKRFVVQSTEGGGWGGRPTEDGPSASCTICQGDVRNGPIESLEQRFPIVVEQRGLRTDSAGAAGVVVAGAVRGFAPLRFCTACLRTYSIWPLTLRSSAWAHASSSAQRVGSIRSRNGLRGAILAQV